MADMHESPSKKCIQQIKTKPEGKRFPPAKPALPRRGRPASVPAFLVDQIGKRPTLVDRGKIHGTANLP
jgi:hypothetical protein